jgi:hypothetical protein
MLYPADLVHTISTDRQRTARQRAEEWRRRRHLDLDAPFRARRAGIPRVALG